MTIHACLVTTPPIDVLATVGVTAHPGSPLLTTRTDSTLSAHELAAVLGGTSEPVTFPVPWPRRHVGGAAVSPARDLAVFTGTHALRAVEPSGRVRWELPHACWARCGELHTDLAEYADDSGHRFPDRGSPHFSADGRLVWAHVLGDAEEWLVVDAATGEVLARAATKTYAHGSEHFPHPDPARMGLALGEGQDGSPLIWGHFDGSALHTTRVGGEHVLLDMDPVGESYLTLECEQYTLTRHRLADDAVLGELEAPMFEDVETAERYEDDCARWRYVAAHIDAETAIAATNEGDVERGADRHWLIDLPTMELRGPVVYPEPAEGALVAIGGGRWMTVGWRDGESRVWELQRSA